MKENCQWESKATQQLHNDAHSGRNAVSTGAIIWENIIYWISLDIYIVNFIFLDTSSLRFFCYKQIFLCFNRILHLFIAPFVPGRKDVQLMKVGQATQVNWY